MAALLWGKKINEPVTRNPRLIIEFDDEDGREKIMLPMNLNEVLVDFIKTEILKELSKSSEEFIKL